MYCSKILEKSLKPVGLILRAKYSRKSAKNNSSYKLIKSDNIKSDLNYEEFDGNKNWELFGPRGFRFYLPGSNGPGWLDQSTTIPIKTTSVLVATSSDNKIEKLKGLNRRRNDENAVLHCTAQECPLLLRKGVLELFPNCPEAGSPQLTIITIKQDLNIQTRWNKDVQTERSAKYFLFAAADICNKLKMFGYWADFINPFSGQPYLNPHKNSTLYKTDKRFRCLGFQVDKNHSCKMITSDKSTTDFIGNLYTTAPPNMEFLQDMMEVVSN